MSASSGAWSSRCRRLASRLSRKKYVDSEDILNTNLRRCLSTFDLTMLSLGHIMGSGIYVVTATVAKNTAGPAIVLAFVFSGIATFLSALSYAELGVRYPKCGSAYSYTYLVLGELWAFLVGWNMALENIIGAASSAKACSSYFDSFTGEVIRTFIETHVGTFHVDFLAPRLDFLALGILFIFVAYMSFGVKMTSNLGNFLTVLNVLAIAIFIGVGAYFSDIKNWTNEETKGFFPYHFSGVLAASASCFYTFVGFEVIAVAGEEANDPQKSIPRATFLSMAVATVAYVGVSSVLTLMVNYRDIDEETGLPDALGVHGAEWAKIAITVGALCGMTTGIICSLYGLTRVIYIMSDDGLLFPFCSKVNGKTKTPLRAMYLFSALSAVLAFILNIETLVELFSVGTLFAYLVVSASVIILRYRPQALTVSGSVPCELPAIGETSMAKDTYIDDTGKLKEKFLWLKSYTVQSPGQMVTYCVLTFTSASFVLCGFATIYFSDIIEGHWWAILVVIVMSLTMVLSFGIILLYQQSTIPVRYKVPLVPFVPASSILFNVVLMVSLQPMTWIRFIVWIFVGLALYFSYGMMHSKLEVVPQAQEPRVSLSVGHGSGQEKIGTVASSREYQFSSRL